MQAAHESGIEWDDKGLVFEYAAWSGSLECIRYAHEHGAPWDLRGVACQRAAMGGHLECLRYLREHGAPYLGSNVCVHAMAGGHAACLRYALCAGCPVPPLRDMHKPWLIGMLVTNVAHLMHVPRALRNAVRALVAAWRLRRSRRLAAIATLEAAWLEFCYRPGGPGAARACSRWEAN